MVGLPATVLAEGILQPGLDPVVEDDGLLVGVGHHQAFGERRMRLPQGRGVQAQRQCPDLLARTAEPDDRLDRGTVGKPVSRQVLRQCRGTQGHTWGDVLAGQVRGPDQGPQVLDERRLVRTVPEHLRLQRVERPAGRPGFSARGSFTADSLLGNTCHACSPG
ncbi:hypothetical protein ACFQ77_15890 [Streptomyces virginiae]|uniref:hypothetical protein n=1 Tax=Streptomyces virginiae TaxID=1961 RepID=UPI00367A4F72